MQNWLKERYSRFKDRSYILIQDRQVHCLPHLSGKQVQQSVLCQSRARWIIQVSTFVIMYVLDSLGGLKQSRVKNVSRQEEISTNLTRCVAVYWWAEWGTENELQAILYECCICMLLLVGFYCISWYDVLRYTHTVVYSITVHAPRRKRNPSAMKNQRGKGLFVGFVIQKL